MSAVRPIIFLDIDGVVAHYSSDEQIDAACVQRLNRIVEQTGADVVISSSWRCQHCPGDMQRILDEHGFEGQVIDETPLVPGAPRGDEIRAFLESLATRPRFVILDDVADMDHELRLHLVQTDDFVGLQDRDVERAVEKLNSADR